MKRFWTLVLSSAMVCAFSASALAEGFALTDWGARGTALGGGMVGRADDASAVAHNPAGITQLPGTQMMGGMTAITPMGTLNTYDRNGNHTATKVERNWWVNPHFFVTQQLNDDVYLGVGVFSRFGLGNSYPTPWPGRTNLMNVKLQTVSLNPNIAYKLTDKLSVAVGVEAMYASMHMEKDAAVAMTPRGPLYNRQELTGDSVGFGGNIALHYVFNDQWSAGLTYRSRVKQDVRGDFKWRDRVSPMQADADLFGTLNLPQVATAGVTYKHNKDLSFEAGVVYTGWSAYQSLDIVLEEPYNMTNHSPKNWKDTWAFNLSTEYRVLDWLTLRAGYVYETSPMNDKTMDYMTPSDGRMRFSGGVGFNWEDWTLDLAYSYIKINSVNYDTSAANGTPGVLPGSGNKANAHVMAATVGYKF